MTFFVVTVVPKSITDYYFDYDLVTILCYISLYLAILTNFLCDQEKPEIVAKTRCYCAYFRKKIND